VTDAQDARSHRRGDSPPSSAGGPGNGTGEDGDAATVAQSAAGGRPPAAAAGQEEEQDLTTLLAERDRYLDQWQRTAAEYANFRRRTEQERTQQKLAANQQLLRELLPVLDDLQRGLNALPPDEQHSKLAEGVRLVEQKFQSSLKKHGVTPIEALGKPFDPSEHEAVEHAPNGGNTVVAVYQPGYKLGDTVLRAAMVKVGQPNEKEGDRVLG
jgi:molecular chaperone GrpE